MSALSPSADPLRRIPTARRTLCWFLQIACAGLPAAAQDHDPRLGRVDPVVFCLVEQGGRKVPSDTAAGYTHFENGPSPNGWQGTDVPLMQGVAFGVRATSPAHHLDPVTITVTHPAFADTGTNRQSWTARIVPGFEAFSYYHLGNQHELVAGDWTITADHEGTMLYAVTFRVGASGDTADIAATCAEQAG